MTASEFSFLALGLVLGVVSGAAIVELIRARPRNPREVKVTVAHDAIPRRASTLADDAFTAAGPEPARGGPADRRWTDGLRPAGTVERRTTVRLAAAGAGAGAGAGTDRSSGGTPVPVGPGPAMPVPGPAAPVPGRVMEPALPLTGRPPADAGSPSSAGRPPEAALVAIPVSGGDDPVFAALRLEALAGVLELEADESRGSMSAPETDASTEPLAIRPSTAVALLDPPDGGSGSGPGSAPLERCAEERRLAQERCELAVRVRANADGALEALRLAQRAYDAHETAAQEATMLADPRAIHAAKETAQGGFRAAVRSAGDPDALEAAARDWLNEINRINNEARDAGGRAAREHAAALEIGGTLERLGLEADAARIAADNADAACLAARAAVAECDERAISDSGRSTTPATPTSVLPVLEEDETLGIALADGGAPRIFRLLRGDRAAMGTVVVALAGDDAEARRRWQLQLTALVEAIVADAIEAGYLEFPEEHAFWGGFTRAQNRDITQALSSLGFRFDGLGGWIDSRYPSQRDLSLALGYAGLDPMRVRNWPNEEATAGLFADVAVAADEYLAGVAGDLTLAEMVTMLGRRADALTEVWNQWGRLRPLLLEET